MITRADIDAVLAQHDTQETQYKAVEDYLKENLAANTVVNGPLRQFLNEEGVGLADVILADLPTYSNWIRNE